MKIQNTLLSSLDVSSAVTFCALVNTGSFTAAAAALGKAKSQLSRELSTLEKRLGAQLLRRTTRSFSLTQEGELCYEASSRLIQTLTDADLRLKTMLSGEDLKIRIASPLLFGNAFLAPVLVEFLQLNPGIKIEAHFANRSFNLVAESIDIAFQFGPLPDSQMRARSLMKLAYLYCASPRYLAKHGTPASPEDLYDHQCIFSPPKSFEAEWQFRRPKTTAVIRPSGRLVINSYPVAKEACLSGLGVARLPDYLVYDEIEDGRLVSVLERWAAPDRELFAVSQGKKAPPPVRDFLALCIDRLHDRTRPTAAMV